MRNFRLFYILLFAGAFFIVFSFVSSVKEMQTQNTSALLPSSTNCDQIVSHKAYMLCYSEKNEQAKWVAYLLTKEMCLNNIVKRKDKFIKDPLVKTGSSEPADYKNSGYDRGHLCPAGDMNWSQETMEESFFMSNISPQVHEFNAGIWERLEKKVRSWAEQKGSVYVVAGGILSENLPTVGAKNKVSVPEYFYKIVLSGDEKNPSVIAFVIANKNWIKKSYFDFVVPVDSVEKLTGVDFFPQLNDSIENTMERSTSMKSWMN